MNHAKPWRDPEATATAAASDVQPALAAEG